MPICNIHPCNEEAITRTRCDAHLSTYMPVGPVSKAFHDDKRFVTGLMGPFASGSSVACCWKIYFHAMIQVKQKDGVRRSRYAVVRSTYRELDDSTVRTWTEWMGEWGELKITNMSFLLKFDAPDGTKIEAEILFRALDKPDDVKKLLSTEYTGAWVNEAREVPKAIFEGLTGRVGRYPSERSGGCVRPMVLVDTNPPDNDHWLYKLFEVDYYKHEQIREEYGMHYQPPGVVMIDGKWEDNWGQGFEEIEEDGVMVKVPIPKAENIENLNPGYYRRMCIGKDPEWIKVYGQGKYGFVQDGKPIYPQYNGKLHCQEFKADPELPLMLGWDAGLTPSCIIGQISKRGQLRILDELNAVNMGVYQFARDAVKPHLAKYYPGYSYSNSWGDPAKTRGEAAEQSAINILNDAYIEGGDQADGVTQLPLDLPFVTIPAPGGNTLGPRLEGVNYYLSRLIDGQPAFLLHPRCVMLKQGFEGRYRYERVQVSGSDERYKELPKKNEYSHPHDALQNIAKGTILDTAFDEEVEEDEYQNVSSWSGR